MNVNHVSELCSNPLHFLFSPSFSLRLDANLLLSSCWRAVLWQHVTSCRKGTQWHFTEESIPFKIWREFVWTRISREIKLKKQDLSGRVVWHKRADGHESGQWYSWIQHINTPSRATAKRFLSWGFPKVWMYEISEVSGNRPPAFGNP